MEPGPAPAMGPAGPVTFNSIVIITMSDCLQSHLQHCQPSLESSLPNKMLLPTPLTDFLAVTASLSVSSVTFAIPRYVSAQYNDGPLAVTLRARAKTTLTDTTSGADSLGVQGLIVLVPAVATGNTDNLPGNYFRTNLCAVVRCTSTNINGHLGLQTWLLVHACLRVK